MSTVAYLADCRSDTHNRDGESGTLQSNHCTVLSLCPEKTPRAFSLQMQRTSATFHEGAQSCCVGPRTHLGFHGVPAFAHLGATGGDSVWIPASPRYSESTWPPAFSWTLMTSGIYHRGEGGLCQEYFGLRQKTKIDAFQNRSNGCDVSHFRILRASPPAHL